MPKVDLRANESQEQLLRRFNKSVVKSKVLADVRRKRWFVSKSELKRIEKKKATRRQRKAQRMNGSIGSGTSAGGSGGSGNSSSGSSNSSHSSSGRTQQQ